MQRAPFGRLAPLLLLASFGVGTALADPPHKPSAARSAASGLAIPPQANATPAVPPAGAASRPLPFPVLREPGQSFAASELARAYSRDLLPLLNPEAARLSADLALLDRYGTAPPPGHTVAAADSSDIRLVDSRRQGELTPEEKKQLEPPGPPLRTSIPSSVATSASLIGGLALLVKLLADMIK
jgi:hypothetical protein